MAPRRNVGNAGSMTATSPTPVLQRPRNGRVIAGVCAGLAARFGWNTTIVRLIFVLSIFLPGPQVIVYLIMWLVIPAAPLTTTIQAPAPPQTTSV